MGREMKRGSEELVAVKTVHKTMFVLYQGRGGGDGGCGGEGVGKGWRWAVSTHTHTLGSSIYIDVMKQGIG